MAIVKVEKSKDYTIMSNYHLNEKKMSLKAKGLMSVMLSLPSDWDYSISGLVAISKENETSIKTALDELREFGYLIINKKMPNQTDSGRIEYEYILYEQKQEGEKQDLENLGVENHGQLNTNNKLLNNNKEILKEISSTSVDTQEPKQVEIVSIDSANNTPDTTDEPIFNKEEYILELFNKIWEKYPRKVNKQLAKKTWTKKFKGLKTQEEILEKARKIGTLFVQNQKQWVEEGRKIQYIPHCSSWLSANVPDKE